MTSLAVIGGGIGGCSAAYFARKYLPNIKVTVYEAQDRLGGRILSHHLSGVASEVGAAFYNDTNKIIVSIVKAEQLKVNRLEERMNFAVWNGSKFIFRSNKKSLITDAKLLERYKLSLVQTFLLLREAKRRFAKLVQEEQKNPSDMGGLFESAGFDKWYKKTFDEILLEADVSQTFIDEIAAPITRTIYSQNADIGGLAGIASLIGVYSEAIYSFVNGNSALPMYLAESSNSTVKLGQKVDRIEKTPQNSYRVYAGQDEAIFNGVIIAVPLEFADINLEGFPMPSGETQYQKVYRRAVKGVFDPKYFGLENSTEPPNIVLTTKDAGPITHYSIQKTSNNESLVTVSSPEPLKDDVFGGMFKNESVTVWDHCWKAAYPMFKPINKFPSTQIDRGLFYLNSIEPSVSSMETSAFSALNTVRILAGMLK